MGGRARAAWLPLLLLLASCKMGPDYQRPPAPPGDDAWRVAPTTAESFANLAWWELLQDEELQGLIKVALKENQDVRVAAAHVEEYRAQLAIARFDLMPSVAYLGRGFDYHVQGSAVAIPTGTDGGGIFLPGVGGGDSRTLSNEMGIVGLKWEADVWGRLRRSVEATKAQMLAREENQRAVILGLVANVAEAYFDLRALDLQIEIAKRTLGSWDESVRLSRVRLEKGYISKLDLDRFEAERMSTAAQLADLERQMVQKENQLSLLLGRRPTTITRGRSLVEQHLPPEVPPGLPSALLQRRPDILQAEQNLAAATANIGVAQAMRFPQFTLTGGLGVASTQLSSLSVGPMFIQSAMGTVAGPILNASALGYQVDVAEAKTKEALALYEKAILTALKEVEDALIAVQKAREQREAQDAQVLALQSALSLADQRYRGGRASYLDVLTAQRTLFEAELALARTRRNQLVAVMQLYKALGGGWGPGGAQADPARAARPAAATLAQ